MRTAPVDSPIDALLIDTLFVAKAAAITASARRALDVNELPAGTKFTACERGDGGWLAECGVPEPKRTTAAQAMVKLNHVTADRLARDGGGGDGRCVEVTAAWREGVQRLRTTVWVWTGNALAVRRLVATEYDGATVTRIRFCSGCGGLATTHCGCSPTLPPLPLMDDA